MVLLFGAISASVRDVNGWMDVEMEEKSWRMTMTDGNVGLGPSVALWGGYLIPLSGCGSFLVMPRKTRSKWIKSL